MPLRARRSPVVGLAVGLSILALVGLILPTGYAAAPVSFSTPKVMGYAAGNDWEPAVESDGAGNVYVLVTHIGGVPGCSICSSSGAILAQVSHDGGTTFTSPTPVDPSSSSQFDPNVKVNASGAVFISYLLGKDTVVQRSTDHGASWSSPVSVIVGVKKGTSDKPGLAVQGSNVYVGFDISQSFFVSSSHDGGNTFSAVQIGANISGLVLNGGAVVDANGTVYMTWEDVHQTGNAQGPQDVLVSKSTDRGLTWTVVKVDANLPPGPPCPQSPCGWDFLGTGSALSVDQGGRLYDFYNAPNVGQGSPYVWYRVSKDGGVTWSARTQITSSGPSAYHVFPTTDAGASGDVRVSWMDNRSGAYNVWYRSSSDGGQTWSAEVQVSQFRSGFSYVTSAGFAFPYGDYYILDLDAAGHVHLAWGEGPNWSGPGNCLYSTA